jgi:hypothetical protein
MTTRAPTRRTPRPAPLTLECNRCGRFFTESAIVRECYPCARASEIAFGTAHPLMEASGH